MNFKIKPEEFQWMVEHRDQKQIENLGGVKKICEDLKSDLENGLKISEIFNNERKKVYGENLIPDKKEIKYWDMVINSLKDKTLRMLIFSTFILLSIGIYKIYILKEAKVTSLMEGMAIIFAVSLVVLVGSTNNYQREKKFKKLSERARKRRVIVKRNGNLNTINAHELLVGDVIVLYQGDIIPADAIIIKSYNLHCDESSITGESLQSKKGTDDLYVISGSNVTEGQGEALVVSVGPNSYYGKISIATDFTLSQTPLQKKLNYLADQIAKIGVIVAALLLISLSFKFAIECAIKKHRPNSIEIFDNMVEIFIKAISILVVAVPEGLPMALIISLSYATNQMMKENTLIRSIAACESMGYISVICTDKTGTLTKNEMEVVTGLFFGTLYVDSSCKNIFEPSIKTKNLNNLKDLDSEFLSELLETSLIINSSGFLSLKEDGTKEYIGSSTDTSFYKFSERLNKDPETIRKIYKIVKIYPFSSKKKFMATVINTKDQNKKKVQRQLIKGAAETILENCKNYINAEGRILPLEKKLLSYYRNYIYRLTKKELRIITLAYKDVTELDKLEDDNLSPFDLTFIGMVGIEDPIREGVHTAVDKCKNAGINIKMITGDNLMTAESIARRCNILVSGGLSIEGPKFRAMSDSEIISIFPKLQVLARSSPFDKQRIVQLLKSCGEVVAVTGDGTNDVPAFRKADVSFSMGKSGTEIAKSASSVILLDEDFRSITNAISWGRCINDSIKKFIQFQLSVNIAIIIMSFITLILDPKSSGIFTPTQLLWLNLIMDTFAALALSTDHPSPELLERGPDSGESKIITPSMWKSIVGQAFFQVLTIIMLFMIGPNFISFKKKHGQLLNTYIFNCFIYMQIFNQLSCSISRNPSFNLFNAFKNSIFNLITFITIFIQWLIIQFGKNIFDTTPLSLGQWLTSISIASLTLPISVLLKAIPIKEDPPKKNIFFTDEALAWNSTYNNLKNTLKVFQSIRKKAELYHKPSTPNFLGLNHSKEILI